MQMISLVRHQRGAPGWLCAISAQGCLIGSMKVRLGCRCAKEVLGRCVEGLGLKPG